MDDWLGLYVTLIASLAWAQEKQPEPDPETLKKLAEAGFLADPQALRAWLYRIARDKAYGRLRKANRTEYALDEGSVVDRATESECEFSADDAAAIANAVLKVSDELVNELSMKARIQLISSAQGEVERTEQRLVGARQAVAEFRDRERMSDPLLA